MPRVGPRRDEDGFGLLEVMFSLVVLLLVLVASSYLVDYVVQQAALNRQKVGAAELAEQYLETTANATLASLQAHIAKDVLLTPTPVTVGGRHRPLLGVVTPRMGRHRVQPRACARRETRPQVVRATMTVKWGVNQSMGETSVDRPSLRNGHLRRRLRLHPGRGGQRPQARRRTRPTSSTSPCR